MKRYGAIGMGDDGHLASVAQQKMYDEAVAWERKKAGLRVLSRVVVTACCAGTAVALPGFGRVMAFMGSFSSFLICIILPVSRVSWVWVVMGLLEARLESTS
jgi:hypothetical protein